MPDYRDLMNALAKQMNADPNKLKNALQSGDAKSVASLLEKQQADALFKLLSDPNALKEVLNSKQAKELQKNFNLPL